MLLTGLGFEFGFLTRNIESNIGEWLLSEKKTFCYTATYLRCITCTTKAAEGSLGWVCKTTGGLEVGSPPAGSRGGALVRILKSSYKFYAFLVVIPWAAPQVLNRVCLFPLPPSPSFPSLSYPPTPSFPGLNWPLCHGTGAPPSTNTGAPWPLRNYLIIMVTISVDRQHYR